MSRISGIIAFQAKKSNLERDLRKETCEVANRAQINGYINIRT